MRIAFSCTLLCLLSGITINVFGQEKDNIENFRKTIFNVVSDHIKSSVIKDSTAIYSFSIITTVSKIAKDYKNVVTVNNEFAKSIFTGIDTLSKLDYSILMQNKTKAVFIFRVYILVNDSKYNKKIDLDNIGTAMQYLFLRIDPNQQDIGALLLRLDKNIYN